MILSDNICTQIGDTIFFETTPIWGTSRKFNGGFSDIIIGETVDRFFEKLFRYSYDGGIIYSDWKTLNDSELEAVYDVWVEQNNGDLSIELDKRSDLKLQFQYKRTGADSDGELILNGLTLFGEITAREFEFTTINNSIFSEIINNNIDLFNLTMNLTNKLYEVGIVPNYIERKKEDEEKSLLQDRDYVDFWKSVTEFYVMLFLYAMRYTNIYWRQEELCEYLEQRGIYMCDCRDIIEMQLITQNFYNEIRSRGTFEIFRPKGYKYPMGKRKIYTSPSVLTISEGNPIMIDGVVYTLESLLPYGWTLYSGEYHDLRSPDMNYHDVRFGESDVEGNITYVKVEPIGALRPKEESDVVKKYNGEYLRLICFSSKCDEFIYNQVNIKDFGWNIYNASPLYKGLDNQYGSIVKAYEITKDFVNLEKYPWFGGYLLVQDTLQPEYCTPPTTVIAYTTSIACAPVEIQIAEIIE